MVNSELMQAIEKIMPEIIEIRRSIHRNPEIGRKEIKTTALIKEKLLEFGADEILSLSFTETEREIPVSARLSDQI